MTARVKICGVCRPADAAAAEAAGAQYLGAILTPGFARSRTHVEARAIYAACALPRVGVFVNESMEAVAAAAAHHSLSAVQLHGDETVVDVRRLRALLHEQAAATEIWKAVRVLEPGQAAAALDEWSGTADAVLLDGWSPRATGGTGTPFDWHAVADALRGARRRVRLVVAGGLTPDNVSGVIRLLAPDIVDVSSGVEEETGRKSTARIQAFIAAAGAAAAAGTP